MGGGGLENLIKVLLKAFCSCSVKEMITESETETTVKLDRSLIETFLILSHFSSGLYFIPRQRFSLFDFH